MSAALTAPQHVNGYIEKVMLLPGHIIFDTKLDTGADFSSLNALHIKVETKQQQKFVSFDVIDNKNSLQHLTYPLTKMITIKARHAEAENPAKMQRPMIEMKICFDNHVETVRVNLVDRENFAYPFLMGREALVKFNALVDPAHKYLYQLKC